MDGLDSTGSSSTFAQQSSIWFDGCKSCLQYGAAPVELSHCQLLGPNLRDLVMDGVEDTAYNGGTLMISVFALSKTTSMLLGRAI